MNVEELQKRVGLSKPYPFEFVEGLKDVSGREPVSGLVIPATLEIFIHSSLNGSPRFAPSYLHEVAHVVAIENGLDSAHDAAIHNKHFASLVGLMYRRLGWEFALLQIYDFGDDAMGRRAAGHDLDGQELIDRFAYVVKRSAQFYRASLTVEQAARWMYRHDVFPAITGREWHPRRKSTWWRSFLALIGLSTASP